MEDKGAKDSKGDENEGSKSPMKQKREGRRRANVNDEAADKDNGISTKGGGNEEMAQGSSKPRRRRQQDDGKGAAPMGGGWMNSSETGASSAQRTTSSIALDEEESKETAVSTNNVNKDKYFQDDNEEIVLIPDLDEEGGGDSDRRIAHAPRNVHRKIPTLSELEVESKASIPTSEDGLKLNILLGTLVPPSMLIESDTLWSFESLLREITDELSDVPKATVPGTTTTSKPAPPSTKPTDTSNKQQAPVKSNKNK